MLKALLWPCVLVSVLVGLSLPLRVGQASVASAPQTSAPEASEPDISAPNDRGRTLDDYARDYLFSGIAIDRFEWLHHRDGLAYGAYGLTPRDFLRFGQAALRAKRHEVGAVVSPAWIDNATTFQVKPNFDTSFDFGLLWWLTPDGSAFTASGHGGQFAYSISALDLEIVVTADPNSNEDSVSVNVTDAKVLANTIASGAV
jgi:hypothetical protein